MFKAAKAHHITIACLCDPYVIESTNSTIPTDMKVCVCVCLCVCVCG